MPGLLVGLWGNFPDHFIECAFQFSLNHLLQRANQSQAGQFRRGGGWHLAQQVGNLVVYFAQQRQGTGLARTGFGGAAQG